MPGKEPSAVRVAAPGRPGWKSTRKDESMSLIEIRDVHKWYGEFHVLKGISERVEKGEVLVICGPSGSGKSSLIRCLNRLEPIQKGDILFEGTSIYAPEVDVNALRAEVGMVFQQFNLYPHLTVLENVTLAPIKVRGMGKKEATDLAMELLGRVGIARQAAKRPSEISGGQQQRVALARAIVIRPQVLLMDEPLSNLDAKLRIEMRNAIKQIQRRVDITTVYVTHDQEEALAVSDRIAVMNGGVICQIGRPADIYKRPKNVFVSTFIGLSNLLDGHIVKKGDKTSISFKENEDWLVDMDNLSGGVEDGEEVIISVRPEEFDMEPGTKEGIRGVIRSSVFLGLTTHYFITTGSGQELEILQTQEGQDILPDGSAVTLTVKAGRINVFRRATEETLIREEGL